MENEETLGDYQQVSAHISGRRVADGTRKNYAVKLKTWKKWLEKHKPECIRNSEIVIPLEESVIMAFFGFISYKDAARTILRAPSTVYGYYSALKFEYSERKVPFNVTVAVQEFLTGFQNSVADAREGGLLPAFEGKQPLSFKAFRLIADFAMRSNESFYSHLYFLLCWNLMGRTTSIR